MNVTGRPLPLAPAAALAWAFLLVPAGTVETPRPSAVAAQIAVRVDALRRAAGSPSLSRRPALDAAAADRAERITALPAGRRLAQDEKLAALLERHGVSRWSRAETRVAMLAGYDDPAATAVGQWHEGNDSRLLDRGWSALGVGAASTPDGELVIVAIFVADLRVPADLHALELRTEQEVNEVRAHYGLAPLAGSDTLRRIARAHSQDMALKSYFDHDSPDGRGPANRVTEGGLRYRKVSENIARNEGADDPVRTAVDGWLGSPGHRANLLDPDVVASGVGIAVDDAGALIFTQLFFAPSGE